MEIVIGLLIGLVVGLLVATIAHRQASTLRAESAQLRTDLASVRRNMTEHELAKATAETKLSERDEQLAQTTQERDTARAELDDTRAELSQTQVKLRGIEADHEARQEELGNYRAELEQRFKGIANTVTESTRADFIKEFRDLTKQQTDSAQKLVGDTVKPLQESLSKLDQGNQAMEKARTEAYADLRRSLMQSNAAIGQLHSETSGLRQALRSPQVRGLWGEQQLQNVLEASGLREHVDFSQQQSHGGARPDVIVRIPGERSIVIDAKTPLDSYLTALEAETESAERNLLNAHANSLMNHARALGQKDYAQVVDDALDFVILFVPSDAILDAALRVRPELFEQSWSQHRVLMATPGSLIAFLRAVAQVWQQQTVQENAQAIADAAHELYDRLSTYVGHLDKMRGALNQTVNHYNNSVGSFQSRVLPSARRIEQLSELEESRRINEPQPVDTEVRALSAPELQDLNQPAD